MCIEGAVLRIEILIYPPFALIALVLMFTFNVTVYG